MGRANGHSKANSAGCTLSGEGGYGRARTPGAERETTNGLVSLASLDTPYRLVNAGVGGELDKISRNFANEPKFRQVAGIR
jgi:hypothetical protein